MLSRESFQEQDPLCCVNCSVGLEKGIRYQESFRAEEDDSWVEVTFADPASYVVLSLEIPSGYRGDAFTVYFAAEGEEYSQELIWNPAGLAKPGLVRMFSFDRPVAKLRLDVCEIPGDTGITSIVVGGFGDEQLANRFRRKICIRGKGLDSASILVTARSALARYEDWFIARRASQEELERQGSARFAHEPLVSIVVPLYNTDVEHFKAMVQSVLAQSYDRWELILLNSTPENEDLHKAAALYADRDGRIRVVNLDKNYGIAGNTNRGITLARGEYVGFLDHDDFIEPDLLFRYVEAINDGDGVDALYCDEDKCSPEGRFIDPRFKPDFNQTLLRNNNYVCHLFMIRKALLDQIGPIPSRFDGAQDHWLILRASELTKAIVHVERVLYHWRLTSSSTAGDGGNKPYACQAGVAAVEDHCARVGLAVKVKSYQREFTYRLDIRIEGYPSVAVVVPHSADGKGLVESLAALLPFQEALKLEVVLVGDGGGKLCATAESLKSARPDIGGVHAVEVKKGGRSARDIRRILKATDADFLAFVPNGFCEAEGDWLSPLLMQAQQPRVGFAGGHIVSLSEGEGGSWALSDGTSIERISAEMGETGLPPCWFFSLEDTMEVPAPGLCFMVAREKLEELLCCLSVRLAKGNVAPTLFRASLRRGLVNVYAADSVLYSPGAKADEFGSRRLPSMDEKPLCQTDGFDGFLSASLPSLALFRN